MLVAMLLALITFSTVTIAEDPKNPLPTETIEASSTEMVVVEEITIPVEEPVEVTTEPIEDEWKYPQLKQICSCESTGSPYNEPIHFTATGEVLRGRVNSDDVGMCQINTYYHQATADKLEIDLLTPEGNKEYAEYLYETAGSTPWSWSEHCWNK